MNVSDLMRMAVVSNLSNVIKIIMAQGMNVNCVVSKTGPVSGYTALHWACARNLLNIVMQLVQEYQADVNCVAVNGIQPIHLACFRGHPHLVEFLLKSGADANASFTKQILVDYLTDCRWCEDFSKMSLLMYATLTNKVLISSYLLDHGARVDVPSATNKTLLMYAVERNHYDVACQKKFIMSNVELLNARDDAGQHVFHYCLLRNNSKRFDQMLAKNTKGIAFLETMINAGADVDVMINGNPNTLPVNLAATRFCYGMLKILFNLERSSREGRPLKYVTIPVHPQSRADGNSYMGKQREMCYRWILKILVLRRALGLFVPEEEIKLMDELVKKDDYVTRIVQGFQQRFVQGFLKQRHVGKSSFFEVAKMLLIREKVDNFEEVNSFISELQDELDHQNGQFPEVDDQDEYDTQIFVTLFSKKMNQVKERSQLMNNFEEVGDLIKANCSVFG